MQYPLVWLAAWFCLGIWFADAAGITFLQAFLASGISLFLCLALFRKKLSFILCLFCLIFFLGGSCLVNRKMLPGPHISNLIFYKNDACSIRGLVLNEPILRHDKTVFILAAQELHSGNLKYNCCGNVLINLSGNKALKCGDEIVLKGNLRRPFNYSLNRKEDNYLIRQGIYAVMEVNSPCYIEILKRAKALAIKRFALWLKEKAEEVIYKNMSFVPGGILDAMVLGERSNIPALINSTMIKAGTVHILVVSGFNTGMVIFIIILFLKLMGVAKKQRFFISLPLLIIYCLMTGASTPVVRATVMAIIFLSAYLFRRQADIYNSCAIALIFILLIDPLQLFDIGSQLSFISVISIVFLYPRIKALLRADSLKAKCLKLPLDGFLVSLSAWCGTVGLIAYYFRIFSPVTVLANIFVVPLAALITLCGFVVIFSGLVFPYVTYLFANTCELLIVLMLHINAALIKLPGAYFNLGG